MSIKELGSDCVGCLSCKHSCPMKAVKIEYNEFKSPYVKIDYQKCIECGKCNSVCPVINSATISKSNIKDLYCVFSSEEIIRNSSSGGAFFTLAKQVLKEGWFVCGAVYSEDYRNVIHIVTNNLEDVMRMRGSKYIESSLKELYSNLDEVLRSTTEKILFSGTPCQCAAIKAHYINYSERFYYVELICNGVMPPAVLEKEINRLELEYKSEITFYTMRFKKDSYFPLYAKAAFIDGQKWVNPFYDTPLGAIYGSRIILRECCYSCNFKGIKRYGDITLGDYHGFACDEDMLRSDYGSSTVIVNNDTGEYLLKVLKDAECVSIYKARHIKEAIKSNNRLMINGYAPCLIHRKRIKRILNKDGIVKAACYSKRFYKKRYVVIRKITERIQNRREIDQT